MRKWQMLSPLVPWKKWFKCKCMLLAVREMKATVPPLETAVHFMRGFPLSEHLRPSYRRHWMSKGKVANTEVVKKGEEHSPHHSFQTCSAEKLLFIPQMLCSFVEFFGQDYTSKTLSFWVSTKGCWGWLCYSSLNRGCLEFQEMVHE